HFLRHGAARRHKADVGIGKVVIVERADAQRAVAIGDFGTERAPRGERNHLVGRKATLLENGKHFTAHIARGADDSNLVTHCSCSLRSPRRAARGHRRSLALPRPCPGEFGQAGCATPFWWSWFSKISRKRRHRPEGRGDSRSDPWMRACFCSETALLMLRICRLVNGAVGWPENFAALAWPARPGGR